MNQPGQLGSGSGKGGGAGGSIREAGGAFGTAGAAKEEAYFRKQQADQLEAMRKAAQQASQGKGASQEPGK
ncbi:ATPase inhibitor, putative [Ixodes scapularis]|uniref:ATPase inhibitor, putative n=1 Tax=Ixodes scapularis TaxID=6945 RepID=B7P6L9_IXOSC|nr:ATPase inhibitor, putative [Ixodes scapularis]|eukprot:XP_002409014.1 ATPase inhibitor, putative [Ixodes scapularis]